MIAEIISIGYGVAAMIGWGCGDFIVKKIIGAVGYFKLVLYSQLVGFFPLLVLLVLFPPPIPSTNTTLQAIIANGVLSIFSLLLFFKGLSVGKASIVTPIASTSSVVAIILSYLVLDETLSIFQMFCVGSVVTGVIIVSMSKNMGIRSNRAVLYAAGCMLSAGLNSIIFKLISIDVGSIGTLFYNRIVVILILLVIYHVYRKSFTIDDIHERVSAKIIVIVGLTEFLGILGFVVGVTMGMVSIVAPIASASPAVTVILARTFLRERLSKIQKIAISSIILGIVILSILSRL